MNSLVQDFRYALRAWRRTPGVAFAAVVTLALGIGVISAVYSIGNGLLWRPLQVPGAERLAVIFARTHNGTVYEDYSWGEYRDFRAGTASVFEDVAALTASPFSVAHDGPTERIYGEMVSANYFTVLGAPMTLGRGFGPAEDSAGAAPVVILSHAAWQARFHGDPGILGRTMRINRQDFTVVGVAAQGFQSPFYVGFAPAIWVPIGNLQVLRPGEAPADTRGSVGARFVALRRPGVTLSQAHEAVAAVGRRLATEDPVNFGARDAVLLAERDARPEPELAQSFQLALTLFVLVAGLVLLIACANVAGLLLARSLARRKEIAVRLAIGAGRGRIVRQLLGESLLLALAGGTAGLGIGVWLASGLSSLLDLPTDIPFNFNFSLDARVVAVTAFVTLGTTFAFGLMPALQATQPAIAGSLRHDSLGWGGRHRSRLRHGLVIAQLALSCLLLAGAGLVARSLGAQRNADLGFETRNGLLVSLSPGLSGYDDRRARALYRDLLAQVRAIPGVTAATVADGLPLDFTSNGGTITAEGAEAPTLERPGENAGWTMIGDGYFETMGTPLLEGRSFGPGDTAGSLEVAVVSRTLAERLWPGQSVLGKRVHIEGTEGPGVSVIGVARDAKYRSISEPPRSYLYLSLDQQQAQGVTLVVRAGTDPLLLVPQVRQAIASLDGDLAVADVKTMEQLVDGRALLLSRIATTLAGTMGLLALALAVVGLYGIIAYAVAQRTRELGIRMALGATSGGILRMVLRDGLRLTTIGLLAGLGAAFALGGVLRGFLYEVSPLDPVTLTGTALVLGGVALLASAIPAWRAGRVTPVVALRAE